MAFKFNPDKYIRTAYSDALGIYYPIYADIVPKVVVIGDKYIIISSIVKTRTAVAKPTDTVADNWGWLATVTFDINSISPSGYSNPTSVEDIEENIVNAAEQLQVPGWAVKSRVQIQSRPLNLNTPTMYINRRVLSYAHWMEQL